MVSRPKEVNQYRCHGESTQQVRQLNQIEVEQSHRLTVKLLVHLPVTLQIHSTLRTFDQLREPKANPRAQVDDNTVDHKHHKVEVVGVHFFVIAFISDILGPLGRNLFVVGVHIVLVVQEA
jgi:hypothetical protein